MTIGIILVAGCQKLENNQDKSLLVEQTESMLDEKSNENTVQFEELKKTLENNIDQIEVYVNSSTAQGTSFLLDTTESIKEIKNLLFKDKDYKSIESSYDENEYDFLLSIYYVSSEKNQEMVDVYVFDPNIIMYNSVFYETENAIDYSYIREQIENNKRS